MSWYSLRFVSCRPEALQSILSVLFTFNRLPQVPVLAQTKQNLTFSTSSLFCFDLICIPYRRLLFFSLSFFCFYKFFDFVLESKLLSTKLINHLVFSIDNIHFHFVLMLFHFESQAWRWFVLLFCLSSWFQCQFWSHAFRLSSQSNLKIAVSLSNSV